MADRKHPEPTPKRGRVIEFDRKSGAGLISDGRGAEYSFLIRDWRFERPPSRGMGVSFLALGDRAKDVYVVESTLDESGSQRAPGDGDAAKTGSAQSEAAELEGTVIEYSRGRDVGRISAGRGDEYDFAATDWREDLPPQRGTRVRFYPSNSAAKDVRAADAIGTDDATGCAEPSIEGTVVEYDRSMGRGEISAGRGQSYAFGEVDWRSDTQPERNMRVSFCPQGKDATDVQLVSMPEASEADQAAAARSDPSTAEPLDPKVGGLAGVVLSYDPRAERGVISAGRGREYDFNHRDWRSEVPPRRNMTVAFHPAGDRAVDIHLRIDEQPARVHVGGYIAAYDASRQRGTISDGHGRNFSFDYLDWRDDTQPRRGLQVEFLAVGADAKEVRMRTEDEPLRIEGMVAEFSGRSNSGTISDGRGGLYSFTRIDWRGEGQPMRGQGVDFLPVGEEAKDVHLRADVRAERTRMTGMVAGFNRILGRGRLSDGHGGIYTFSAVHWRGDRDPSRGDRVEFLPFGSEAREVHPAVEQSSAQRTARDRITGVVAEYSRIWRRGRVADDHGEIYEFAAVDWRGDASPRRGDSVEFFPVGDYAKSVSPARASDDAAEEIHGSDDAGDGGQDLRQSDSTDRTEDGVPSEPVETEGWISAYQRFRRSGIVATATGAEFTFQLRHWFGDGTPERGMQVTFVASASSALNVLPVLAEREGTVSDYQWMLRRGTIAGDDGRTYGFGRRNWTARQNPLPGDRVTFSASGDDATVVRRCKSEVGSEFSGDRTADGDIGDTAIGAEPRGAAGLDTDQSTDVVVEVAGAPKGGPMDDATIESKPGPRKSDKLGSDEIRGKAHPADGPVAPTSHVNVDDQESEPESPAESSDGAPEDQLGKAGDCGVSSEGLRPTGGRST